jgi:light-regulated signal transduction histidine kinase (bacteriophytochrome)
MPTQQPLSKPNTDKENHLLYRRIIGVAFLSVISLLTYLLVNDYYTSVDSAEKLALQNLRGVVDNLAQRIDGDLHESLSKQSTTRNPVQISDQNKTYQAIHNLLKVTQQAHSINSPIFTFVKTGKASTALAIIATSEDSPGFNKENHSLPETLYSQLDQGGLIELYKNENGHWLSAFAPIKNSKGEIIAYVQADNQFDPIISEIRAVTAQNTTLCLIGLAIISLLLFPYIRQILQQDEEVIKRLQQSIDESQRLSSALEKNEQQLQEYATKLEDSNKELTNFAQIASHDLKSPMRNIHGFAQLIKKRQGPTADENTLEYLDFIINSADRATKLINSLLSYSQAEKDLGEQKQFNLSRSILQAQHLLYAEIQKKKADIKFEELPVILANPILITQVFQNLINNAIKYNQADYPIIEIGISHKGSDTYCFYIKDNGIGIAPEYHQKVFDIFTRLHSIVKYEGSGIGLAYCKRIITAYGGSIWLESSEDKGTTVYFTLPKSMVITAPLVDHTMSL